MNARLRALLTRAAQTNPWQSLTFDLAMTDRGALESRLLKVSGLGLKSAREVLDIAVGIDKEIRARRMLLPSQLPLEVPPPTIEETTPFFDTLRWQPISQRLRNILAAAESTTADRRTIADFLGNRYGFRNHVLRQNNIGKKTEEELTLVVERLLELLRQRDAAVTDTSDDGANNKAVTSESSECSIAEMLDVMLHDLAPRAADILRRRSGLGGHFKETLEELGQAYGLTRERIRQVEDKALRRLRLTAISSNLKAFLQRESAALWKSITGGSGVLLADHLEEAAGRLSSEARFAIELAWGSIDNWLSATWHGTPTAWLSDPATEILLTSMTQRVREEAKERLLPFAASSLTLSSSEATVLESACHLAGLHFASGYVCVGRPRGRRLRTIRLHSMLAERPRDIPSASHLVERYRLRFKDDPCSTRDSLIVMGDAPHLFVDVVDDQWAALTNHAEAIHASPADIVDQPIGDAEPASQVDASIASTLERILERDGPLRFTELRERAMRDLLEGQSRSSIAPVLLTSGRFGRIAPGLYGLPSQVRDVARGDLLPASMLATDQCRWFVTGLYAGCSHGDFPAWTRELELRLCQWAESANIDSTLFESLLAVVEPDRWSSSKGDREYWGRIKAKRAHYWLTEPPPPLLDSIPPLDRLLAAAMDARRRGGSNWICVNRAWSKRVDHDGAASLLAVMVASGVLKPADHWQRHHDLAPDSERVIRELAAGRMRRGVLKWDDEVGAKVRRSCRGATAFGWVARGELLRLVDALAIDEDQPLAIEPSTPSDDLEERLKQLRIRRQAAFVESLLQEERPSEKRA